MDVNLYTLGKDKQEDLLILGAALREFLKGQGLWSEEDGELLGIPEVPQLSSESQREVEETVKSLREYMKA